MTTDECAVVMAYTGVVMLTGKRYGIYLRYLRDKLGRDVYVHELGSERMARRIREAAREDFIRLCREAEEK